MTRTIHTSTERAELAPGTIAVDEQGNAWKRGAGSWVSTGEGAPLYDDEDRTLTVLIEGGKPVEPEVKRLRGERRDLLKKLDEFERDGHTTVGIAFLRRHFEKQR
jgi:hypothetical protein